MLYNDDFLKNKDKNQRLKGLKETVLKHLNQLYHDFNEVYPMLLDIQLET